MKSQFGRLCIFPILMLSLQFQPLAEEIYVQVDSLYGKAEIQRAGQNKWVVAKKGIKLFNNDMLRLADSSRAVLIWTNGSTMYVHPNSQLVINLYEDTTNDFISKHATVFFGAVFFVIKEALPKAITGRWDTKIYTPTAVVSIRGTSFEVRVEKNTGSTQVSVLNGTVLVGNILGRESIFLPAGYQTTVGLTAEPLKPSVLTEATMAGLKIWLPADIMNAEMQQQLSQSKKDYYTLSGKMENKILIIPLSNTSTYQGAWDLSTAFTNLIATRLGQQAKGMSVIKADSSSNDIMQAGSAVKARFALSGEIRAFEIIQRAAISVTADDYQEFAIARVRLHVQLIDIQNKKMIFAKDITGEVSGKNQEENSWKALSKLTFKMSDKEFSGSILGQAITQAVEQSAGELTRYIKQ